MKMTTVAYAGVPVKVYTDASFNDISSLFPGNSVIVTDEHVFSLHENKFAGHPVIQIKSGEENKTQAAVDRVVAELLELNVDKSWMLIGVGGGVVSDLAGYAASIYKRGIKLGLVPTTILGMTDAAIGGKNGVNVGIYKNMVGTTYRPQFILYDWNFLDTLPKEEFVNGFAEIIKHACIKDAEMFKELQQNSIEYYIANRDALATLIEKNIAIKTSIVVNDEHETGDRYLLNFGHTFGHAIENLYRLPHGHAVSIGMQMAAKISEELTGFNPASTEMMAKLSQQYGLPVSREIDLEKVLSLLLKDKKRQGALINFVLLDRIGNGLVKPISFGTLRGISEKMMQ